MCILSGSQLSSKVKPNQRVQQGNPLSSFIFNAVIDWAMEDSMSQHQLIAMEELAIASADCSFCLTSKMIVNKRKVGLGD